MILAAVAETIVVALITVGVGGLISLVIKWLDIKANRAKEDIGRNTAEVEAMTQVVTSMQTLANTLRTELDRKTEQCEELEKDLLEEKALNTALMAEVERLRQEP